MRLLTLAVVVCALFGAPAAVEAGYAPGESRSPVGQAGPPKPNIVMIYLDDTSPHDGRLWSDPDITPTLHEMFVRNGIHFENAVAETPLCCPGRAGLLTGLHTHNHGVTHNDIRLFNPGVHIGKSLKAAGYETTLIGKYFNHPNYLTASQWTANAQGWTNLDAIRTAPDPDFGFFLDFTLFTKQGNVAYPSTHSTRVIAERAVARLQEASPTAPIFTLLAPYNTHNPNLPLPEFVGDPRCADMQPWKPPNYNEADVSDKPWYIRDRPLLPQTSGWPMRSMCEEMLGIDWMVSQVRDELDAQGRLDNTLFVFAADNGMGWGQHRSGMEKQTPYAAPIPLYMSWPSRWGNARTITDTVSNIDLAPTFCALGGCTLGNYPTGQSAPDGISLLPVLDGSVNAHLARDAVLETVFQKRPFSAIRTSPTNPLGFWHWVEYKNGERELYDLSGGPCTGWVTAMGGDPCELTNLASDPSRANLRTQLSARLAALLAEGRVPSSPQRPDGRLAVTAVGTFKGWNIYGTIPKATQTQTIKNVVRSSTHDFLARVTNHGAIAATYKVHGTSSGSSRMQIRYYVGATDVTSQVNAGTYSIPDVQPGASFDLTIRVIVGSTAPVDAKKSSVLTFSLVGQANQIDVLKAVAERGLPPPTATTVSAPSRP